MLSLSLRVFLVLSYAATIQAVCSSDLLIDNYAHYSTHKNSLGLYTSDDGTTRNLTVDVVDKKVTFNAISGSYFYTNLGCFTATEKYYSSVTFPIKGPAGFSFVLELQTTKGCPMMDYTSYYYTVPTKMTGSTLTVTVPLTVFTGANLNALHSFVFEGFAPAKWEIGSTQLICANNQSNSVNGSTASSSRSSSFMGFNTSTSTLPTTSSTRVSSSNSTALPITKSGVSASSISIIATSASRVTSSSTSPSSSSSTPSKTTTSSLPARSCAIRLIDDFASQSRLLSQHVNALQQPSWDDGTMRLLTVANKHLTLTPIESKSYFYTSFGCLKATNIYGGINVTISAKEHTVITVELRTSKTGNADNVIIIDATSKELGWSFDGTEQSHSILFTKFLGLDTNHLMSLRLFGTRNPVTLGAMSFYCEVAGAYGN